MILKPGLKVKFKTPYTNKEIEGVIIRRGVMDTYIVERLDNTGWLDEITGIKSCWEVRESRIIVNLTLLMLEEIYNDR